MEDIHDTWPHRWISPKIKCSDSDIQGLGTFAIKDIKKGEIVTVLGGVIVHASGIINYREKLGHVGIQVNDDFFMCPTSKEELLKGVFNHSCSPNVGLLDTITWIAMRGIKNGEEIVIDYAFCESFHDGFKCNCGSHNCRKFIKSNDWKLKSLQNKYGKYFSPYLRAKF